MVTLCFLILLLLHNTWMDGWISDYQKNRQSEKIEKREIPNQLHTYSHIPVKHQNKPLLFFSLSNNSCWIGASKKHIARDNIIWIFGGIVIGHALGSDKIIDLCFFRTQLESFFVLNDVFSCLFSFQLPLWFGSIGHHLSDCLTISSHLANSYVIKHIKKINHFGKLPSWLGRFKWIELLVCTPVKPNSNQNWHMFIL